MSKHVRVKAVNLSAQQKLTVDEADTVGRIDESSETETNTT